MWQHSAFSRGTMVAVVLSTGCNTWRHGAGFDDAGEDGNSTEEGEELPDNPVIEDLPAAPIVECDGDAEHLYIWVANSGQGTVSKIEADTLEEVGRYVTRPDSAGDPSRTSVSVFGNVAVANRLSGVVKIHADIEKCSEQNGTPGIQTSTGRTDVLAWGEEECVAFYTPMEYTSQRPVAWTPGNAGEFYEGDLWTAGTLGVEFDPEVSILDGESGEPMDSVVIEGTNRDTFGLYGGAVDHDGNLWATELGLGKLVFVDRETMFYKVFQSPGTAYGMAVDRKGRVWTANGDINRFDPATETWETLTTPNAWYANGVVADGGDTVWFAANGVSVLGLHMDTFDSVGEFTVELSHGAYGISIDFRGRLWTVGLFGQATRIDLTNGEMDAYTGLDSPYTYSDMTGYALCSVAD